MHQNLWAKLKWLSSGLPNRRLRVQIPSLTPDIFDFRFAICDLFSIRNRTRARSFNRQNAGLQNRSSLFKSKRACQIYRRRERKTWFLKSHFPHNSFSRKASQIGLATVLKTAAKFFAYRFESYVFRQFFTRLRSSTESERKNTNLEVAGSNPAEVAIFSNSFRGRPTGRTLDFESRNKGSNPFPEAKLFY